MRVRQGMHRSRSVVLGAAVAATLLTLPGGTALAAKNGHRGSGAPSVSISSPAPGAFLRGTVVVSGSASSSLGIAGVAVSIDGSAFQAATGTASWTFSLNTTAEPDGGHTVAARAADTSGAIATQSITVTVDNGTPSVSITSPASGATVSGTVAVSGTASDPVGVTAVTLSVDSGPPQTATGTSSWSSSLSTSTYATGTHTLTATATNGAGTAASASISISVSAPAAPPAVAISSPAAGATLSGTVTVSGTASSGSGLSSVQVQVDTGVWQNATGTTGWSYALDTTLLSNAGHTLTARATDSTGATASSSINVTVSNTTTSQATSATCADGSPVLQQLVTPEGATIDICTTTGGWTASSISSLLSANALDLSTVGPDLTVQVQTTYASAETSSAMCCDSSGHYYSYKAIMYLNPSSTSTFSIDPDALMAHEYGHAWTYYWMYMNPANNGSWAAYDSFRWANSSGTQVLAQNANLNTQYCWTDFEMAADDYRRLFGTSAAQTELSYLNPYVPDSQQVTGLATWFLDTWR